MHDEHEMIFGWLTPIKDRLVPMRRERRVSVGHAAVRVVATRDRWGWWHAAVTVVLGEPDDVGRRVRTLDLGATHRSSDEALAAGVHDGRQCALASGAIRAESPERARLYRMERGANRKKKQPGAAA